MNWAEKRIQAYSQGQKSTWLERRILEHANPVHFVLVIVAKLIGIYGVWMHDWKMIALAVLAAVIGHMYTWLPRK